MFFLCTECSCSVLKPVRLLNSVFCDRILRKIDKNFTTAKGELYKAPLLYEHLIKVHQTPKYFFR